MANVRGGSVGSIRQLRRSLKKKSGSILERVPAEGSLLVRFLTEPDEWSQYWEHYDDVRKYYPCSDDECPGCIEGNAPKKRYLANVLIIDDSRVVPLTMPKTLASQVFKGYDKYSTVMDRDYDLSRTGTGYDTEYSAFPEAPTKRNLKRYDLLDLKAILDAQLGSDDEDDDEDDEEEVRKPIKRPAKKIVARKRIVEEDEEDEDDDEEEEDDTPPVTKTRPVKRVVKAPAKKPRRIIRS